MARRQLELSNEVAAELAGAQDQILRTLEEHLDCAIYLRGNVVTLDGDADAVQAGATVVRELSSLVARGHEIGPGDDRVGRARARRARVARPGARGRRLAPPQPQGHAEVGQPEALRRRDPALHDHVRRRPGRHRQDVPGHRDGGRRAEQARGQPHHPHPPRGRGRRAARLPARRPDGEGRSLPAPAVRRAARHARRRARRRPPRARGDRGRAARVHARAARSTTRS